MLVIRYLLLSFLIFSTFAAEAEVYKWTDEKGKVHFGDKVPEKYKNRSSDVDVKANVVDTVQSPDIETYTSQKRKPKNQKIYLDPYGRPLVDSNGNPLLNAYGQPYGSPENKLSCEEQMKRYKDSKSCFGDCAEPIRNANGVVVRVDMSNCRRCGPSITRPDC